MILNDTLKIRIKEHALLNIKEEACGLILSCHKTKNPIIFQCRNDSPDKKRYFSLNPYDYIKAKQFGTITAFYHSHPSGNPKVSDFDKINAQNHKLKCIIYSYINDTFTEYIPKDYKFKYIGREFILGKQDCYSLVKEYYKEKLNIELGDYIRQEGWLENTPYLFENNNDIKNFIKIPTLEECKENDILLFKFYNKEFPTHCCVYLGNNIILNHDRNKYSCIESIPFSYKNRFCYGLRYAKN